MPIVPELRLEFIDGNSLVPIVQSVLNQSPVPQRANTAPVTGFMGIDPTPAIKTFVGPNDGKPVTLTDIQFERSSNIAKLQERIDELHPVVAEVVRSNRTKSRNTVSKGDLPNFVEGDYVLVARDDFHAGQKLALRWRGPRRIVKPLSDYVLQIEDPRNCQLENAHGTRLKFYRDDQLDAEAIMLNVLSSETGMPVSRLMGLIDDPDGLKVLVRWKGLPDTEDSLEPIDRVYEDDPKMFLRLLDRKNTPSDLAGKVRRALGL